MTSPGATTPPPDFDCDVAQPTTSPYLNDFVHGGQFSIDAGTPGGAGFYVWTTTGVVIGASMTIECPQCDPELHPSLTIESWVDYDTWGTHVETVPMDELIVPGETSHLDAVPGTMGAKGSGITIAHWFQLFDGTSSCITYGCHPLHFNLESGCDVAWGW